MLEAVRRVVTSDIRELFDPDETVLGKADRQIDRDGCPVMLFLPSQALEMLACLMHLVIRAFNAVNLRFYADNANARSTRRFIAAVCARLSALPKITLCRNSRLRKPAAMV